MERAPASSRAHVVVSHRALQLLALGIGRTRHRVLAAADGEQALAELKRRERRRERRPDEPHKGLSLALGTRRDAGDERTLTPAGPRPRLAQPFHHARRLLLREAAQERFHDVLELPEGAACVLTREGRSSAARGVSAELRWRDRAR